MQTKSLISCQYILIALFSLQEGSAMYWLSLLVARLSSSGLSLALSRLLLVWALTFWPVSIVQTRAFLISVPGGPIALAINPVSNKIYVANVGDDAVTVI